MLPVFPLVILIGVSTMHRRVQQWKWMVAFTALTFVVGWFVNPWYRFAPEDNLNYADYVRLHQRAAAMLESRYPHGRVLTAWPASDELSKPYLGYVSTARDIVHIKDFSFDQIVLAKQNTDYDA